MPDTRATRRNQSDPPDSSDPPAEGLATSSNANIHPGEPASEQHSPNPDAHPVQPPGQATSPASDAAAKDHQQTGDPDADAEDMLETDEETQSVSMKLPKSLVAELDQYRDDNGHPSRSAALVAILRAPTPPTVTFDASENTPADSNIQPAPMQPRHQNY